MIVRMIKIIDTMEILGRIVTGFLRMADVIDGNMGNM
jgi:hypothetical protein